MSKEHYAKRVLSLIDAAWNRVLRKRFRKVVHVYSLDETEYALAYDQVIRLVYKRVIRLNDYGWQFANSVVGEKIVLNAIHAIVDDRLLKESLHE